MVGNDIFLWKLFLDGCGVIPFRRHGALGVHVCLLWDEADGRAPQ